MNEDSDDIAGPPIHQTVPGLLEVLQADPQLAMAVSAFRARAFPDSGELSATNRELVVVALDLALRNGRGAILHATRAIQAGATRNQLREILELVMYVAGPTALASVDDQATSEFRDLLDSGSEPKV